METAIISSAIEAGGVILAAAIGTFGAHIIVKKNTNAKFKTYADRSHNAKHLLKFAESDVTIVAGIGDTFFKTHKRDLEWLMKKGIRVKYLIQTFDKLKELRNYINEVEWKEKNRTEEVDKIKEIKKKYNDLFELREFNDLMTASYIGVDIWGSSLPSSAVQVMLYQYQTKAKDSAITTIFRRDKKVYDRTVESICAMWDKANKIE